MTSKAHNRRKKPASTSPAEAGSAKKRAQSKGTFGGPSASSSSNAPSPFPIQLGAMFRAGFVGYRENLVPLTVAGAVTFAAYAAFRIPSQILQQNGQTAASVALDLLGLVIAGALALPWFAFALQAARGSGTRLSNPIADRRQFLTMIVCGFWFWAAFMLGLRYLGGIPSILTVVYYAFYGFAVAENPAGSARQALGLSVRLGNKRRIGLFAIAVLFALINLCGMFALGLGVNPLTITLAIAGLLLTTNITLVGGASLYDVLTSDLPEKT